MDGGGGVSGGRGTIGNRVQGDKKKGKRTGQFTNKRCGPLNREFGPGAQGVLRSAGRPSSGAFSVTARGQGHPEATCTKGTAMAYYMSLTNMAFRVGKHRPSSISKFYPADWARHEPSFCPGRVRKGEFNPDGGHKTFTPSALPRLRKETRAGPELSEQVHLQLGPWEEEKWLRSFRVQCVREPSAGGVGRKTSYRGVLHLPVPSETILHMFCLECAKNRIQGEKGRRGKGGKR